MSKPKRIITLLMAVVLMFPASAALAMPKNAAMVNSHNAYFFATEHPGPWNGIDCASDISHLSESRRKKICALKKMGAWSGSRFHPNADIKRKQVARILRKMTQYGETHWPDFVDTGTYNTDPAVHGKGRAKYQDVTKKNTNWAENLGIGFVAYERIDRGCAYSSAKYCPNQKKSNKWVNGKLDKWGYAFDD